MINLGKAERYYNQASIHFNKSNFEKALIYYNKALESKPDLLAAWNDKGLALVNLGIYNEALTCYNEALAINPNYVLCLINKANILLNINMNYEESIACYDKLLLMDSKLLKNGITKTNLSFPGIYADIWNNRGLSLFNLDRFEESQASYLKALDLNSVHVTALKNKEIVDNEIKLLKSIECPNCKINNYNTAIFCQECGKKIQTNEKTVICNNCSFEIDNNSKFCPECGQKVEKTKDFSTCPNCQYQLIENSKFCPECGENLGMPLNETPNILVDINNHPMDKIASIPSIGPIMAKKAINIREAKGGFESVHDFNENMGLKPHVAKRIEKYIMCTPMKKPKKPKLSGRVVDW